MSDPLNVLTPRQRQMVELAAGGMRDAQIAQALFVTRATVKSTLRAAYKRLEVNGRTQAAVLAVRAAQDAQVRVPPALWAGMLASLHSAQEALPRQYPGHQRLRQILAWASRVEDSRAE